MLITIYNLVEWIACIRYRCQKIDRRWVLFRLESGIDTKIAPQNCTTFRFGDVIHSFLQRNLSKLCILKCSTEIENTTV